MATIRPRATEPAERADLVRAAFRVSLVSVGWTLVSSTVAVTVGIAGESTVLIALGSIGFVDAVGSTVLAFHFLHGLRHDLFSARREKVAHRSVSLGLVGVGVASVAGASYRLAAGNDAQGSWAGAVVAVASLVVLAILAARKRGLGLRLRDRALIGDSHLSAIGAVQAAVALAGIAITEWLGAAWADATAALAVGILAVLIGTLTWKTDDEV